jgi:Zn-dependent protease with chaperone function
MSAQYHRLIVRLSILAVFLFCTVVYLLNLKYWIQMVPGVEMLSTLQSIFALVLFFFYLSTIWFFAYSAYRLLFRQKINRKSFVISNLRFNIPLLLPWLLLSLFYDLMEIIPGEGQDGLEIGVPGSFILFAGMIILMVIYLPAIMQSWWGCKPLKTSAKVDELKDFLHKKRFKYRELLTWPIFEGRMMTAGIMGLVARYRYILITDSLMNILSIEEVEAVLSHEMGHARYHHLFFNMFLLVGFMVISYGIQELLPFVFYLHPFLVEFISGKDAQSINLFYLVMSIPILVMLVVYFRYIMGFFMRNFERQADLYSAKVMGTPVPTIKSLEKIAYFSGKIRNLPSWHHFSIKERVDCLTKTLDDPTLIIRHNRFVAKSILVYIFCATILVYAVYFSSIKERLVYSVSAKVLTERLLEDPDNISLYQDFAMVCHEMGEFDQAVMTYEKIIAIDPDHAISLNNLAWIYVTAPDEKTRDIGRALDLAKRAVAVERSAVYLDTLAEAYYTNGYVNEAVKTIEEAIFLAKENQEYYQAQLEKFLDGRPRK